MYCDKCGTKIKQEGGCCTNCGTAINNTNTVNNVKEKKSETPYKIICVVCLICMFLVSSWDLKILFLLIALVTSITGYIKCNSPTLRGVLWMILTVIVAVIIFMLIAGMFLKLIFVDCLEGLNSLAG